MKIREMFAKDIDRDINGVVKVDSEFQQLQEVTEYIITKELRRHLVKFFNVYNDALTTPTEHIGVWISGFFGSGKSHFLKMLSYILDNKEIDGKRTVEYFREKFNDEATFGLIDKAAQCETETILFNIDVKAPVGEGGKAVPKVFTKVFYDHLGYYGDNIKVARFEEWLKREGKNRAFEEAFEKVWNGSWKEARQSFEFVEDEVAEALTMSGIMSETAARNWLAKAEEDITVEGFVRQVKEYVDSKGGNFRLLFMIDEVGQYIGEDTNKLLNLQTIVEQLGSKCLGKVWIVCTGQEALDKIIKARTDEFSRIQGRFYTRLSLTSSSVDEVIQRRLLEKTESSTQLLKEKYARQEAALKNLFAFRNSPQSIKGYANETEFVDMFPFASYQFRTLQDVFTKIRTSGNAGTHLASGERSMLSGFKEAAQKIKEKDENSLAPFYLFYDTVHSFLDNTIRRVIERAQAAAERREGLHDEDVNLLKLLYLVRYIDEIKATPDNLTILMAEHLDEDLHTLCQKVRESLERLVRENYVSVSSGEEYRFLTNEEQEIQKQINNTLVESSEIAREIQKLIADDIVKNKKFRQGNNDFDFEIRVDGQQFVTQSGLRVKIISESTNETDRSEAKLIMESGNYAIIKLADTGYFKPLQNALKIAIYAKKFDITNQPETIKTIVRAQQAQGNSAAKEAVEKLKRAIETATFYSFGQTVQPRGTDAKAKIDDLLGRLAEQLYSKQHYIELPVKDAKEIKDILTGNYNLLEGNFAEHNTDAQREVEEFVQIKEAKAPCTMAQIHSYFSAAPYGWKENDIAAVTATLIANEKLTAKYSGEQIAASDSRLAEMLYRSSKIGTTVIARRVALQPQKKQTAVTFLREYFGVMDIPAESENALFKFITENFREKRDRAEKLLEMHFRNQDYIYPGKAVINETRSLTGDLLSHEYDGYSLVETLVKMRGQLLDNKEELEQVESFFKNQLGLYQRAYKLAGDMQDEACYFAAGSESLEALGRLNEIITVTNGTVQYRDIPKLDALITAIEADYKKLLADKRQEISDYLAKAADELKTKAQNSAQKEKILYSIEHYCDSVRSEINEVVKSLSKLDGRKPRIDDWKNSIISEMERAAEKETATDTKVSDRTVKTLYRDALFKPAKLRNENDIDRYISEIRTELLRMLDGDNDIDLR